MMGSSPGALLPERAPFVPVLVAISLLALLLRTIGLGGQPLTADDVAVGVTAHDFVSLGWPTPTMWHHPRLRDLLVVSSQAVLGPGPWGLKGWSVLFGTLAVPAVALLVREVGAGTSAALLAALLVALDPLHVDFSRQAINDVYLSFFPVAGLVLALRYRVRRDAPSLLAAGLLFGLGAATKWSGLFLMAVAVALALRDALRTDEGGRWLEAGFVAAALGALPLAVYAATFLPWFQRGYGLGDLARLHGDMASEVATHAGFTGTKRPGLAGELARAWQWYLRPVFYVDWYRTPAGGRGTIIGFGNPLAWLAVWPAAAYALWRAAKRRDRTAATLLLLFAASYLPFLFAARPIFTNTAVTIVPVAMALVAHAALAVREAAPRLFAGWAVLSALAALLLWPPATGRPTAMDDAVRPLLPAAAMQPKVPPRGPSAP